MSSMNWHITKIVKRLPKMRSPVLIEGLPGIGNVGKLAVDFVVDELNATKAYEFFSYSFPHSVFVNEDNLVELPSITLYYKKRKHGKGDLLLLTGDVQPIDEYSCYEFSDTLLDLCESLGLSEVITLGGIGLPNSPSEPKVYITGNSKKLVKFYTKDTKVKNNLFGVVGPIVGVSGLLIGLAGRRKIEGITLLAETYGHPMYLGMRGARHILELLNTKLDLRLDLNKMDKEIEEIEADTLKRSKELSKASPGKPGESFEKETSYIG